MMRCLAGIRVDPENPGYKHIILRPQPAKGLDWVKASHISPYGPIRFHWDRNNEDWRFLVMLPPNTTARICLPVSENHEIFEGNHYDTVVPVETAEGVHSVGREAGYRLFDLESGDYCFRVRQP
jgi:alpha-L-rhamnosidase